MCLNVCLYTQAPVPTELETRVRVVEAGVEGCCELPAAVLGTEPGPLEQAVHAHNL